eukprot:COSAG06_NODE_5682_length_3323_cov_3.426489_2_plen_973_part_01
MAGKLILELEVGSKWDGITSILRDELRGDEAATSREQGVIRASLAGLKGSKRDTAGARQLFKLFGLVPEDTSCPLECLQMMYDAVYEPDRLTSVLHIRKWLKMLIDRSLVLGTVDRASLHDLVLDFTIGLHSKAELVSAHRRVVEAFRRSRPTNASVAQWDRADRDDAVTVYVLDESTHHVRGAHEPNSKLSDDILLGWLLDQPQDVLIEHISEVLGEKMLTRAAEAAEAAGENWEAACRWSAVALVVRNTRGGAQSVVSLGRAVAILGKLQRDAGASTESIRQRDDLELSSIISLSTWDLAQVAALMPRLKYLLATDAAKAHPDSCYLMMLFTEWFGTCFAGDIPGTKQVLVRLVPWFVRACAQCLDPVQQQWCCVMLVGNANLVSDLPFDSEAWDWTAFGDGEYNRLGITSYSYDKHHWKTIKTFNLDYFITMFGIDLTLALHFGDLESVELGVEKSVAAVSRMMDEPNPDLDLPTRLNQCVTVWPYLLGKGDEQLKVLVSSVGSSWSEIDAICDRFTASSANAYYAPRGQAGTGAWPLSMDAESWLLKFMLALCGGEAFVSKQELIASCPTPSQLAEFCCKSPEAPGGAVDSAPVNTWTSVHLLAALTLSENNVDEEALGYLSVIHELDPNRGGDPKATSHALGHCLRGRIMARRGQLKTAAEAFDKAVAIADRIDLPLLIALAMRDLQLCVLGELGHGDHGTRRLGAVLRRLKAPPSLLTPLLGGGLDAAQLIELAPPESVYEVAYPPEACGPDHGASELQAMRKELCTMKLRALKVRAREQGVSDEALEDADDADDIKSAVTQLILDAVSARAGKDDVARQALVSELAPLKLKALKKRARSAGVDDELLEDADDADDIKAAVIELIIKAELSVVEPTTADVATTERDEEEDRPHFGAGVQSEVSSAQFAPAAKHVMLSYQWDHQAEVTRVYDILTRLGVNCWMDIRSGMGADIYDGMANAVSNASVVV